MKPIIDDPKYQNRIVSLVFIKQPFPAVHSKHTTLTEDQLVLQLFSGAAVEIISFSSVKASLIGEGHQSKPTDLKMIEGMIHIFKVVYVIMMACHSICYSCSNRIHFLSY